MRNLLLSAATALLAGTTLVGSAQSAELPKGAAHNIVLVHGAFVDQTFAINVLDRAEYTLTPGTDIIPAATDNAQFIGNSSTLNASDNLDGGDGTDSLVLYGGGTFDLNSVSAVTVPYAGAQLPGSLGVVVREYILLGESVMVITELVLVLVFAMPVPM